MNRAAIPINNEYFEWLDLLEAISVHKGPRPFVFVELGAAYGRWSMHALKETECFVIAVEADPGHFADLRRNLQGSNCRLVNAPIAGTSKRVYFYSGNITRWWGQAIIDEKYAKALLRPLDRFRDWLLYRKRVLALETVTLEEVLSGIDHVNLIDMDVQGTEAEVIESSLQLLRSKVSALHIGTHSHEVEARIRKALADWTLRWDFPCLGERNTPVGRIVFQDGVLSYLNPDSKHLRDLG